MLRRFVVAPLLCWQYSTVLRTCQGKNKKFSQHVEQITFSGTYANAIGQSVLYVTERAVFCLTAAGMELKEVAPGIDIQKDILDQMNFQPIINDVKAMDSRIFLDGPMGFGFYDVAV